MLPLPNNASLHSKASYERPTAGAAGLELGNTDRHAQHWLASTSGSTGRIYQRWWHSVEIF